MKTIATCCPVVELRQYALHPGARETLIELFDREFVESQEATGMCVIAQFRDIDRPDVFTWLRGFPDMESRAVSLGAFYNGPVWTAHRDVANATMVSSDNVRLLRPVQPDPGFVLGERQPDTRDSNLVVATIYTLLPEAAADFPRTFADELSPHLVRAGAPPVATFETELSCNTFPRLPVREGEHAFVWFAQFKSTEEYDQYVVRLADGTWSTSARDTLERSLAAPVEVWRLAPTTRSRLFR